MSVNEGIYKNADGRQTVKTAAMDATGDTLIVDGSLVPLGYQQLTALTASTALTVPAGARIAIIQPEAAGMRWRDDGTAPTASVGMVLALGDAPLTYNGNLGAIRLIQTATGGILNVSYYG